MYLKKLEIQGFKSFADKTEIEFKDDITAIIGPNGSGKSNISDAIRWVLGEQSAKSLRGSKMEDIIFSGTDKRRALGLAEVTISFDNKDKLIPVDYTEVAVTRRMFRSGESEFYINKNSCRLKDIRELFMDTGIGKEGYSIIGQGRIEEILSDRPEDRRGIFEEAAGIVKYKTKKNETERKLSSTEGNLVRIKDLIHEIRKQFETLEVEAEKATQFTELYEELKRLEVNLYIREIEDLREQFEDLKLQIEKDSQEIKLIENSKIGMEDKFNQLKDSVGKIEKSIEEFRNNRFDILQSLEKDKNQVSLFSEKENFYKKDMERLNSEIIKLKQSISLIDEEIVKSKNEEQDIHKEYNDLSIIYEEKGQELNRLNEEIDSMEDELEKEKSKVVSIYNSISDKRSQLNSIDSFNDNIDKRLLQLNREIDSIIEDRDKISLDLEKSTEEEKELKEVMGNLTLERSKYEKRERDLESSLDKNSEEIKSIQIKLQGVISSYNLYRNMEEGYEGYYRSVKNLLSSIKRLRLDDKGFIGVVAELLKVDELYEKAIDIALGSSLQNIVTESEADAKRMIDYLKKNNMGRVTFLPLSAIKANTLNLDTNSLKDFGVLGLGHELIDYDVKYKRLFEHLLGRTIIVDNIDNGIRLANRFNHIYRIVTLDGDILNPGGSLTGGSYNNNAISIISRKNRIKQLKAEIEELKEELNRLEDKRNDISSEFKLHREDMESLEVKMKELELSIMQLNNRMDASSNEKVRLSREMDKKNEEIDSLKGEVDGFKLKKEEYVEELGRLEEESRITKDNVALLAKNLNEKKVFKENIVKEVTELKINLNTVDNKLKNIQLEVESNLLKKKDIDTSIIDKSNMIKDIEEDIFKIGEEKLGLVDRIENREEEETDIAKTLENMISEKDELMDNFYREQEELKIINDSLGNLEREKNKKDLKLSKCTLQLENKSSRLMEDYQLSLEESIELEDLSIDLTEAKPKISKLKSSIKELGNVNLGAIEDYKEVKERLNFIETQHDDLVDSKANLEKIIDDMEKKMRTQFLESFKEINENFGKVFSVLFNGGKGRLELDSEDDILNTGIEIKVQPPGKKLQNLNLLSGGEKSLTAVALLFAILETKPSPFCILDEIDAALDDANIGRYTDYLRKFNSNTQFILITHRKPTMEISDVLYGVTMAEEGVSKLISVKLKDNIDELVS